MEVVDIQMQEEFLSHFKHHFRRILPTKDTAKWNISNNTNKSFEEVLILNEQEPSHLYFIPNWNYALTNSIWSTVNLNIENVWRSECWVYAYILDFNLVKFPGFTMDSLLNHIKSMLEERLIIPWRYIVRTKKWYHVYFILDHDDRDQIFEIYWYDQLKIVKFVADALWADWTTKVTTNVWALFRLPYSYYWNLWEKELIKIVSKQDKYVKLKDVDKLMTYIKQYESMDRAYKNVVRWVNWIKYRDFIERDIKWVIEIINWRLEYYIDQSKIIIDNNSIQSKIWENLFENFAWNIYQIIWCMAKWVESKIKSILENYFWFTTKIVRKEDWPDYSIEWNWFWINFYEDNVQLKTYVANNKWDLVEKTKIIFRNNIKILWRWRSNSSKMWWEWDSENSVFIFDLNWEEKIVQNITDKKTFNRKYPDMFFFWDDNDLWLFFHWLSTCDYVNAVDIYERNWYYDDVCILGDRCIVWYIWQWKIMLNDNSFELAEDVEQITVLEYFDKFRKCYKDEFAIPLFLAALSLAWMNLRNALEVNPAVLVSWKTWCGKSTVAALLKRMLWYSPNVREMALPGITPQPLKQVASDNAILFLEELTNRVWASTEELLRNVVNRDKAARWWIEWNTWWNFRSPLRVNGERTFKDESLNNRFCSFIMSQNYWKEWAWDFINSLFKYTSYMDVYNTFINNRDIINDLVIKYKEQLLEKWYNARSCDVRSYIFVINDIFNFNFSFDELCKYVDIHLESTWQKTVKTFSWILAFERFMTVNIISNKINITVMEEKKKDKSWNMETFYVFNLLFIDENIYQQNRWSLNSVVAEINTSYDATLFEVDEWWIMWHLRYLRNSAWLFSTEADQFIADMFSRIVTVLPSRVTSNNKSLMLIDR